jgi:hypothetical protein
MNCDIAIVGTGSLARSLAYSLSALNVAPSTTVILGRSAPLAAEIAYLANARACVSGNHASFTSQIINLEQIDTAVKVIERLRPQVLVNCASLQSPWEGFSAPSAWTQLLSDGGFGVGLPLHFAIARCLAEAIRSGAAATLFINASYPDAVNPLLHALGLPVFCGIGNVATLSASLHAALKLPYGTLKVLGHHAHLRAPLRHEDEAKAWHADEPLSGVGSLLAKQRSASPQALNAVTAHAAATLLAKVLAREEVHTNLPGPLGLPGGYPVRIWESSIALDLPSAVTMRDAVAWQSQMAERDGLTINDKGVIGFGFKAREALSRYLPELPQCVEAKLLPQLTDHFLQLREELRAVPA